MKTFGAIFARLSLLSFALFSFTQLANANPIVVPYDGKRDFWPTSRSYNTMGADAIYVVTGILVAIIGIIALIYLVKIRAKIKKENVDKPFE
jgi:hypothetical protein